MTTIFLFIGLAAFFAGGVAAIAGFGIGSILTPLLGLQIGVKLAVAAVSLPHLAGTAVRFVRMRKWLDAGVFRSFGITSAVGGLAGAVLHAVLGDLALTGVFSALLLFAGTMGLTGRSDRLRFGPGTAWLAGLGSGVLGGLVGNQGGIRSAALLGFSLDRHAFVATATGIALIVDAARIPVYLYTTWTDLVAHWPFVLGLTVAVVAGTLAGEQVLRRIPERLFQIVISSLLILLGVVMALELG
ncbi:MAG: TSUP family transporter [Bryobacteraceae bacterium]